MTTPHLTVGHIIRGVRLKIVDKKLPGGVRSSYSDQDLVNFLYNGFCRMERRNRWAFFGCFDKVGAFKNALLAASAKENLNITAIGSDSGEGAVEDKNEMGEGLGTFRLENRIIPISAEFGGSLMSSVALESQALPEQGARPAATIPPAQEEAGEVQG